MASTSAERKAKQRREMLDKGFSSKDLWLSKKSISRLEKYKADHNLKSNDDAINQILENLK